MVSEPRNVNKDNPNETVAVTSVALRVEVPPELASSLPISIYNPGRSRPIDIVFDELTPALVAQHGANLVLSPVLAEGFDAMDVAARLAEIGYCGAHVALAENLPSPELIEREVRNSSRGLDFKIVVLGEGATGKRH